MRVGRTLIAVVAVAGTGLVAGGVQGIAALDQRLEAETTKPKPVKHEASPRLCPEPHDRDLSLREA